MKTEPGIFAWFFPMKLLSVFFSLVSLILFIGCEQQAGQQVPAGNTSFSSPSVDKTAQLKLNLAELLAANSEMQKVDIDLEWDAYFKERRKYSGYPLLKLLDPVLRDHTFEIENTNIIFECSDGYSPSMELNRLFGTSSPRTFG